MIMKASLAKECCSSMLDLDMSVDEACKRVMSPMCNQASMQKMATACSAMQNLSQQAQTALLSCSPDPTGCTEPLLCTDFAPACDQSF